MKKSIGKLIAISYRHLNIVLNHRFAKYGIGAGQYSFYLLVAESEGINQLQISRKLNVNKGTANKALRKLEDLGYIETRIDERDRRLHCQYLTDKGRDILGEVREELKECTEILVRGLSEEQRGGLLDMLEVVESNVRKESDRVRSEVK